MAELRSIALTDGFGPGSTRAQGLVEDVGPLSVHLRTPYAHLAADSSGDVRPRMGHGTDTAARMGSTSQHAALGGD